MSVEFKGRPQAKTSVPPQHAENGFFKSWYPVAMSSEVGPEQVIGKPLLDGKVAVFRGRNGQAHVVSAYCRYMGADLSGGAVINALLRCPYRFKNGILIGTDRFIEKYIEWLKRDPRAHPSADYIT